MHCCKVAHIYFSYWHPLLAVIQSVTHLWVLEDWGFPFTEADVHPFFVSLKFVLNGQWSQQVPRVTKAHNKYESADSIACHIRVRWLLFSFLGALLSCSNRKTNCYNKKKVVAFRIHCFRKKVNKVYRCMSALGFCSFHLHQIKFLPTVNRLFLPVNKQYQAHVTLWNNILVNITKAKDS